MIWSTVDFLEVDPCSSYLCTSLWLLNINLVGSCLKSCISCQEWLFGSWPFHSSCCLCICIISFFLSLAPSDILISILWVLLTLARLIKRWQDNMLMVFWSKKQIETNKHYWISLSLYLCSFTFFYLFVLQIQLKTNS